MDKFIQKTKELLKEEQNAEVESSKEQLSTLSSAQLKRRGVLLGPIKLVDMRTALYGRTLLKFEMCSSGADTVPLEAHRLRSGDIVSLRNWKKKHRFNDSETVSAIEGVVINVTATSISVVHDPTRANSANALDSVNLDTSLCLCQVANDVTHRRMMTALSMLEKRTHLPMVDVLFGDTTPQLHQSVPMSAPSTRPDEKFNEKQLEAIDVGMRSRDVAVIHGPPGTGKTTTVCELINRLVSAGQRVLCCAPSNVAIDNVAERLEPSIRLVRLGHVARVMPTLLRHTVDAQLRDSNHGEVSQTMRADLNKLVARAKKLGVQQRAERRRLHQEMSEMRRDLRQREQRAVTEMLANADVVLSTCVGAAGDTLFRHVHAKDEERLFDVAIIDECGQSLEAAAWIAALCANRIVLAGDHCQLPPTVHSAEAERKGLGKTLMDRAIRRCAKVSVRMLEVQYRMNERIMKWSSEAMYGGRLRAAAAVREHLLADIAAVDRNEYTETPLLLIDTAHCDECTEVLDEDSASRANVGEARCVVHVVRRLLGSHVSADDIGIITPYNAQVQQILTLLREELDDETVRQLEVDSVDGFQGREKEAIVLSMVRSNDKRQIGFLSDDRRTNVAMTRARRFVCLIGDSSTLGSHKFLASCFAHFEKFGTVKYAVELLGLDEGEPISGEREERRAGWRVGTEKEEIEEGREEKRGVKKGEGRCTSTSASNATVTTTTTSAVTTTTTSAVTTSSQLFQAKSISSSMLNRYVGKAWKASKQFKVISYDLLSAEQKISLQCLVDSLGKVESEEGREKEKEKEKVKEVNEKEKEKSDRGERKESIEERRVFEGKEREKRAITGTSRPSTPMSTTSKVSRLRRLSLDDDTLLDSLDSSKCANSAPRVMSNGIFVDNKRRCSNAQNMDLYGLTCKHCNLRFCLKCIQPEMHGCGKSARSTARSAHQQSARSASHGEAVQQNQRLASVPDKLSATEKAVAERRFRQKLAEQRAARTKKEDKKDKKEKSGAVTANRSLDGIDAVRKGGVRRPARKKKQTAQRFLQLFLFFLRGGSGATR